MIELFDYIYDGLCDFWKNFIDFWWVIAEMLLIACAYLTIPIWIIPYLIVKKKKEKGCDLE